MLIEIWKPVPNFETKYEVSNFGRLRNRTTKKLKPADFNNYGYARLQAFDGVNSKKLFVHRLVAIVFIGEPTDPTFVVNHIDGDKTNNMVNNLEWVSRSDNDKHKYKLDLQEKKKIFIPCKLVTKDGTELFFESISACGRAIGLSDKRLAHLMRNLDGFIPEIQASIFKCVSND